MAVDQWSRVTLNASLQFSDLVWSCENFARLPPMLSWQYNHSEPLKVQSPQPRTPQTWDLMQSWTPPVLWITGVMQANILALC